MDKYVKIRVSVKTKPMQNVDIPKHTKAKPITIEMNADENMLSPPHIVIITILLRILFIIFQKPPKHIQKLY